MNNAALHLIVPGSEIIFRAGASVVRGTVYALPTAASNSYVTTTAVPPRVDVVPAENVLRLVGPVR